MNTYDSPIVKVSCTIVIFMWEFSLHAVYDDPTPIPIAEELNLINILNLCHSLNTLVKTCIFYVNLYKIVLSTNILFKLILMKVFIHIYVLLESAFVNFLI